MWSKTRKGLLERLAPALRRRVDYCYEVYTHRNTKRERSKGFWPRSEASVFEIRVDGETKFATTPEFWSEDYRHFFLKDDSGDSRENGLKIVNETGFLRTGDGGDDGEVMAYVHEYLNVLPFDEALRSGNGFIRLLAFLDRRLGKRRLRELVKNVESEPEWLRPWIRLRAESEEQAEHVESYFTALVGIQIERLIALHWFRNYDNVDPYWFRDCVCMSTHIFRIDDDKRPWLTPESYDRAIAYQLREEIFAESYREALAFFVEAFVEDPDRGIPAPERPQNDSAKARQFVAEYLSWAKPYALAPKEPEFRVVYDRAKTKILELMGRQGLGEIPDKPEQEGRENGKSESR